MSAIAALSEQFKLIPSSATPWRRVTDTFMGILQSREKTNNGKLTGRGTSIPRLRVRFTSADGESLGSFWSLGGRRKPTRRVLEILPADGRPGRLPFSGQPPSRPPSYPRSGSPAEEVVTGDRRSASWPGGARRRRQARGEEGSVTLRRRGGGRSHPRIPHEDAPG